MDALEDILGENYVHPNINARYSRLKIRERIKQSQGLPTLFADTFNTFHKPCDCLIRSRIFNLEYLALMFGCT